jgi:uncharacterized repeat protein (TIGR03806 family)
VNRTIVLLLAIACIGCPKKLVRGTPQDSTVDPRAETPEADAEVANDGSPLPDGTEAEVPPGEVDPYLGRARVYSTTCKVSGAPTTPPLLSLTQVLGGTDLYHPVQVEPDPLGGDRVFIVEQPGVVQVADAITTDGGASVWFDITDRVEDGYGEAGLLSIAFHPSFKDTGYLYTSYTRTKQGKFQSFISRFQVADPWGTPETATEVEILKLDQPAGNHNGGDMAFGPDQMLYLGFGDGGGGGDTYQNGKNKQTLLSKFLRLDVVSPGAAAGGYLVPRDNPFVGDPDFLPEIWAWGLRNPWRFSFDPVSGQLWAADVGQGKWEEIDIIEAGKNYGWSGLEGSHCYPPAVTNCETKGFTPPVTEYSHSEGLSVTGGFVYRGKQIPSLYGTYIFGDYASALIWGLAPGADGTWQRTLLADPQAVGQDIGISAFAVDPEGELLVVDHKHGRLFRLVPSDPGAVGNPGWPPTLSETGCFSNLATQELAPGILRYSVNTPLWSDGAEKERGIALPNGATIAYSADGAWELPDQSILIKTFRLGGKPLETRFLVRQGDVWRGATYRYNEVGDEAYLLAGAATAEADGQTWYFPSRADCATCHTKAAGQVLGLRTAQLNRSHDLLGVGSLVNQVEALAKLGYLSGAGVVDPQALPRFASVTDAGATLTERARAYLDANCAQCHRPGGLIQDTFDLRYATPLKDMGACDAKPLKGDLGVARAKLILPGDPDRSLVWLRVHSLDPAARMPPLASGVVDELAAAVVRGWLLEMGSCDE